MNLTTPTVPSPIPVPARTAHRLERRASPVLGLASLAVAAALLACILALAACGGGGGGSGSSRGGSTAPGTGTPQGTANQASQAHWQVALAALAGQPAQLPVVIDSRALDAWNELIARCWPEVRREMIDPRLVQAITSQLASLGGGGAISVRGIRDIVVDTAAPLALRGFGQTGARQDVAIELPRFPDTWTIGFTVDVGATISTQVFGFPISTTILIDVRAEATGIRIVESGSLDVSNPARPRILGVGQPQVQLSLQLSSQSPFLQQVTAGLTQILDPVLRVALVGGAFYAQSQIGPLLAQVPSQPFGTGQAPAQAVTGTADLEAAASEIAEVIRRDHMPWGTVLPAIYDQPGYGNGRPIAYFDHGDSVGWTNHFVMSEVIRFDLTGDPAALAGAIRGMDGTLACLEVSAPGDGLLGRCVVPMNDPLIAQISGDTDFFVGVVNGQAYGTLGDMSRDHYIESLMGTMQAWLRVPSLRPRAVEIVGRMVAYLERNDWNVYKPGTNHLSRGAPFAQAPGAVWAFTRAASLTEPARFGHLATRYQDLTSLLWLAGWGSAIEVHDQYYKFNLGHDEVVTWCALETDPARYRDYVRVMEVYRDATGHHDNAWFDSVYGMAVPAAAPAMGPRIRNALERWLLRDRRTFPVALLTDPTVPKVFYNAPTKLVPEWVATHPVPIEKRPPNDYLWQRSPFELTGWRDQPDHQYPGIDLVLPYWLGRAYGMVQ